MNEYDFIFIWRKIWTDRWYNFFPMPGVASAADRQTRDDLIVAALAILNTEFHHGYPVDYGVTPRSPHIVMAAGSEQTWANTQHKVRPQL